MLLGLRGAPRSVTGYGGFDKCEQAEQRDRWNSFAAKTSRDNLLSYSVMSIEIVRATLHSRSEMRLAPTLECQRIIHKLANLNSLGRVRSEGEGEAAGNWD